MQKLIRSPLTWMMAAEIAVVGALVVVAWHVVVPATRPAVASSTLTPAEATADESNPLPDLPILSSPRGQGPLPGLNLESAFWRDRLTQLNRDQVDLEQLEWQIVHSAEDAVKRYVETVVLPAIQRAEREEVALRA